MKDTVNTQLPNNDLPKLSQPAQRALAQAGYHSLEQFTLLREDEVLKLHGMGPKSIRQIREALAAIGKSFAE